MCGRPLPEKNPALECYMMCVCVYYLQNMKAVPLQEEGPRTLSASSSRDDTPRYITNGQ